MLHSLPFLADTNTIQVLFMTDLGNVNRQEVNQIRNLPFISKLIAPLSTKHRANSISIFF